MRINPAQLKFARQRRGLSMRQLADLVDLTPKSISQLERGEQNASTARIQRLASELNFPVEFLVSDQGLRIIPKGRPSFRAMSRLKAGPRDSALALGQLGFDLSEVLESLIDYPKLDVPDLSIMRDNPEGAAAVLREQWNLGNRPLPNTVHLLESRGVRVFSLAKDCTAVDAFAVWDGRKPFVFLNTEKSGERGRFDACHELGHLVLHREDAAPETTGARGKEAERQANAFASAFLMPRGGMSVSRQHLPTLKSIMPMRHKWNVSVPAMVYRLHSLGVLSAWEFESMFVQISKKGWRKKAAPGGCERESSLVLRETLGLLRKANYTHSYFSQKLKITSEDVNSLMFGMLIHSLPEKNGRHLNSVPSDDIESGVMSEPENSAQTNSQLSLRVIP